MKTKKLIILIVATFALLSFCTQCTKQELETSTVIDDTRHELPVGKHSLKVLAIGNSFLDDPMAYLESLVHSSGIDQSKLCVYSAVKGGTSLEYWANTCKNGDEVTIYQRAGNFKMTTTQAPLIELLAQDWDVVSVQQLSNLAQNPDKISPFLPYLISQIREHCPNKNVVIAWQQVWTYWRGSIEWSINDWENINNVVKMTFNYGVDMVIPTGTAIQNARMSVLNTPNGLLRDDKHLGYGVGRYVAACTWFEALIAPVYDVSIVGNTATHDITDKEKEGSKYETSPVTDINRLLCQQCAAAAVANPFQLVN